VSSPGIERAIKKDKDFDRFSGEKVRVRLYNKIDGKKEYIGKLLGLINNKISIEDAHGNNLEFEKEDVSKVNIYFEF